MRFDEQAIATIMKRWQAGEKQADIARSLGVTPSWISQIINRQINPKGKRLRNYGGRPSEGKRRGTVFWDEDNWSFLQDVPEGDRSKVANEALRRHRALKRVAK